ncbi:BEN domain-containing protein 5-like [Amblyomma americanum]
MTASAAVGPTAQVDNTVGITNEAGEVHVGHGSYVPVAAWNRLLALGSDSTFCKQLAVCLWGNKILAQSSLTGTLSNNAISKGMTKIHPPLSPLKVASVSDSFRYYLMLKGCSAEELSKRHKKVVRYLAQKCCDLRRQDKTAFEPQEPAARSLQPGACSQEPACSQGSVHEQVLKKA